MDRQPNPIGFREIVRVVIEPNLHLVFSERRDGLISVAQQKFFYSRIKGKRESQMSKNALIVDDEGLEEACNGFFAAVEKRREEREQKARLQAS